MLAREEVARLRRWVYEIEDVRDEMDSMYREAGGVEVRNPLLANLLPIASTVHDRGVLLLAVLGPRAGAIIHFTEYGFNTDRPEMMTEEAATFAQFLGKLTDEVE